MAAPAATATGDAALVPADGGYASADEDLAAYSADELGDASADEAGGFGATDDEGDGGGDGGGASGDEGKDGKKKRTVRRRKTATQLNLLRDPQDVIVELTEPVLQELAGARKLHQLRYPTYVVCTHPNFQLRAVEGLMALKGTALKELDLSENKLMVLDALEQFTTLKTLKAVRNEIAEVTIERLPRLRHLDLSHNMLQGIPDLSGFKALAYLNLSHNLIGTRPDSETSRDGWENFKNATLQQLQTLDLSSNRLDWDQKAFNEQVATLKDKKLRHISFAGNAFVEEVEAYRIWVISNCSRLVDLDGEKVTPGEKRARIKDPPAVVKETKANDEESEYLGKKVTVKLFEQTADLMTCFDTPERTLETVQRVRDQLLRLIPIDHRGRVMFDYEAEDTRNELELMEAEENDEAEDKKSEHGTDFRPPADIIEEFMQTLMLLVERQPAAAPKVLRLLVLALSLENEKLAERALEQMLDLLEAGSISELVVDAVMNTLIPQLTEAKIPMRARDLLLRALHTLADEGEGVKEAMRPLAPTLAGWLGEREPTEAVLGVVASASKDKKTALELRDERVPRRAIALLTARETRRWPHRRRQQLLRIVQWTSLNDKRAAEEYSKANVHVDLLNEVGGAVSVPGQFSEGKSSWVAQLISTIDAMAANLPATRDAALKSGYVDRLLRIIASQLNIRAPLLTAVLRALAGILSECDPLMFKKITFGLGGVVPLLQYIQGRKYEQLAELCGEVDESGVVPLRLLRNRDMMAAIGAVVGVIKVYCLRANQEDADAVEVSNKLDAAGREQVLFQALEAPDDDLKVLVMECLLEVPIDNLQAQEVANIVSIIADCDNLTVGRTEEILSHAFAILQKLAEDEGEEGTHFRRFHAATIPMALDILVRNSGRDTRGHDQESVEKAALSVGAVAFLRASSFEWVEAQELMQTRDSVDAMLTIMKNEQEYGLAALPVWIERTAVGSSVQALISCMLSLDLAGEIAGRVLTRMAEVLEGRHTDEEIASADVMQVRDMGEDTAEATKKRIAQHALFVQIDGTRELIDYLLRNIELSPSAYAPSGVSARLLAWAKEQQRQSDLSMVATEETTMDLPDIKVEGYEFLFTEHLHALDLDIAGQNVDGNFAGAKEEAAKGKDDLDQTSAEGKAVAAAFRVLLALLRYGTETTKKAVLDQIRDTDMLRSLICLADDVTNGRWYPANVGPNLLLIMQDLCRLPSTTLEEQPTMVVLYDMITIMLRSALSMLEPKLDAVIAHGKSAVGHRLRPMGEQEELLMHNIILAYGVMCETIAHMRFADDAQVNVTCRELALQCLLPLSQMRILMRYLYYENLLSYAVWQADEGDAALRRQATVQSLTSLLAEHLCLNEDTRWELLEVFSRYEVVDLLALRPSFIQTLLMLVQRRNYEVALQPHLAARRIFPEPERVICASWVRMEPSKRRRLVVVSSRAYYILKEPLGQRCTACDPHLFCPSGPEPVQRLNFRDVHALTIGFGEGQRVRILWSRHRVTMERPAKQLQFSVTTLGVADRIATAIHALNPLPRPPPMEPDLVTERVIREKLLEPGKEEVRLHLQLEKLELGSGRVVPRVAVITSTSLYLFVEDAAYFLIEPQLTASERRSGRKDGINLLKEDEKYRWNTLVEVDFLAGDQSVMAVRFAHGSCQLRFGDDFGLMVFKRELRRLLPSGVDSWRRNFGFHADAGGGAADEGEEGADADADAADDEDDEGMELGDDDHQGDD